MSQSIDVGTVIGGRYKVTSSIVTSQGGDLVLDGVDQVLNRPVSILVAGRANADQLAQSAREVAMGERHGAVQVLDLGISHGSTYLITNHTSPADLLDLVVPQEDPYVEPFFTDTLGSELFGESRSHEPETYDGTIDPGRPGEYIRYDEHEETAAPARPASGSAYGGAAAASAAAAAAAAAAARRGTTSPPPTAPAPLQAPPAGGPIPPPPAAPPRSAPSGAPTGAGAPSPGSARVTPWPAPQDASGGPAPTAAAPVQNQPAGSQREHQPTSRPAAVLPAAARPSSSTEYADYEDDESTRPRSMPWLVGGVLAVVLVAALIFAFTTLGGLFQPQQSGTANGSHQASQQTQPSASGGASSSETGQPTAPAAPPAIDAVTRLNPEELTFADSFDSKLPLTFDGNPATFWSGMEFAREDWGGFTKSVVLAVKLKDPAQIKQVTLLQSGGSGGNFSIYTNNQPSLTGAALAGTSSFTGPQVTVPVSASPTAQYVLIQINSLPRLSAPQTQYPFGLRLAEIKVE